MWWLENITLASHFLWEGSLQSLALAQNIFHYVAHDESAHAIVLFCFSPPLSQCPRNRISSPPGSTKTLGTEEESVLLLTLGIPSPACRHWLPHFLVLCSLCDTFKNIFKNSFASRFHHFHGGVFLQIFTQVTTQISEQ